MEYLLITSVLLVFYTYIGYPLLMTVARYFFTKKILKQESNKVLTASVVIAVRNEATNIIKRLENLSLQNYPHNKIEIIVVSDGSTDDTVSLINEFIKSSQELKVKIFSLDTNEGKPRAINFGVRQAQGEILVFTDARQEFEPDVISELVSNFSDPVIGCVSGELFFRTSSDSNIHQEMGAYWKYEKYLRKTESAVDSVVGVTGAIYAMRKLLYKEIPENTLIDDVLIPMLVSMQGYRIIFDENAIAYDIVSTDTGQEWMRKVRTLSGNWQLLFDHAYLLNPFKNKMVLQFVSHKILRLLVPFLLLLVLALSFMLVEQGYFWFFVLQMVVYIVVLLSALFPAVRKGGMINLLYFFAVLNAAVVVSFYKVAIRRQTNLWKAAYKNDA